MQLLQLAIVFFKIGLFSIGGGYAIIPLIQAQVVDSYGWLTQQTFTDIITISQMTPGPLAVNTSTFVGIQVAGIAGAIVATIGCIICGICISIFLYRFFKKNQESIYITQILNSLKASSLGLIISAAAVILLSTFTGTTTFNTIQSFDWIAAILFTLSFIILRKWKINPIFVLIFSGIIGGILYYLY